MFGLECAGILQAAHVIGRRNYRVRYSPDNCFALCQAHHRLVDQHQSLGAKVAWAIAMLGDEGWADLALRALEFSDRKDVLREQLEEAA
jgi:hypothetical protein